jgi:hypothetical protein
MGRTCSLSVSDETTPERLDMIFNSIWAMEERVKFEINTTRCNNISLGRILSMKNVLDLHRPNSRKYLESSTILVKTQIARRLLQFGLALIRTEKPVYVKVI